MSKCSSFIACVIGLGYVACICVAGCGTPPKASVGDFQVYNTLHLAVATASMKGASFDENLGRFFAQPPDQYEKSRLRMDVMLDGPQRLSGYIQAIEVLNTLDVTAALSKGAGGAGSPTSPTTTTNGAASITSGGNGTATGPANAGQPPATQGSDGTNTAASNGTNGTPSDGGMPPPTSPAANPVSDPLADYRKKLADVVTKFIDKQVEGDVIDSPFDELDRVADFYSAFTLKSLRMRGDSRTDNPKTLWEFVNEKRATSHQPLLVRPTSDQVNLASRLLVLYVQANVDSGTMPNYMTGVHVTITGAKLAAGSSQPLPFSVWANASGSDLVKVIRLHPTRNYDIDQVAFAESLQEALTLTGKITASEKIGTITASGSRNAALQAESRRKFISRIGKSASFADASTHTFGWNFYPSNIQVVQPGALESLVNWLVGTPRQYNVKAYLEGGSRDCSVVLLVPRNLQSITCNVTSLYAPIDPDTGNGGPTTPLGSTRTFDIVLPAWSDYELAASSDSAENPNQQQLEDALKSLQDKLNASKALQGNKGTQ